MREGRASAQDKLKKGLETNVITDDNPGFKMMKMMGYKMGNGLGKQGTFKNVRNNNDNNKVPKNVPNLSVAFRAFRLRSVSSHCVPVLPVWFRAFPSRSDPLLHVPSLPVVFRAFPLRFDPFRVFPLHSKPFRYVPSLP